MSDTREATKEETNMLNAGYGEAVEDFLILINSSNSLEDVKISYDTLADEHRATLKLHKETD